jgi:hypothetical protein
MAGNTDIQIRASISTGEEFLVREFPDTEEGLKQAEAYLQVQWNQMKAQDVSAFQISAEGKLIAAAEGG